MSTENIAQAKAAPESLRPCPGTPNCVSSQSEDDAKRIDAFQLNGVPMAEYQAQLETVIQADGGVIKDAHEGYLWATYTSSVFRFVDDIEWLYHPGYDVFDVRSASRVGRSDFGVNAKRVERLRAKMTSLQN